MENTEAEDVWGWEDVSRRVACGCVTLRIGDWREAIIRENLLPNR